MTGAPLKLFALAVLILLTALGCGEFGRVNQGRVIAFDGDSRVVTLIQDSNYMEPGKPRYDVLPPVTMRLPDDPSQMGPVPEAGKLVNLNTKNRTLAIFDAESQTLKTIEYALVERKANVLRNDPQVRGRRFPSVDRDNRRITVYLSRAREVITFSVPEEYLALPDDTWKMGDEIRYYYKDPRMALRFMNITRTDIR
jgi:uncharacterized protein DUF4881